jgi:nitrous oxidase accessory protein NosD
MSRVLPAGAFVAAVATALLAVGTLGPAVAAADTAPNVVVVDDDGLQCPQADTDSVQEALDMVRDGGRVRVCPGRYAEQLTITRTVHLQGEIGAVASLDCLDPTASALDDLDPTRFAILEPDPDTGVDPATHVRIAADGVELAGFVVQGLEDTSPQQPGPLYDAAVSVSDAYAGTRVRHNLIRLNTLGVELGGSGEQLSRVDHNCFRDNRYAVANQRYPLTNGRIDDNTTFRTETLTFEMGWDLAGMRGVSVDHNTSWDPGFYVVYVDNSSAVTVAANAIHTTRRGVHIAPANDGVDVVGNSVGPMTPGSGTHGVVIANTLGRPASQDVVVAENTVSGLNGFGILLGTNAFQTDAVVASNRLLGNAGDGITVAGTNTGNSFKGNVSTDNGGIGLRFLPGATGNVLTDNTALRNTGKDAVDQGGGAGSTSVSNQWVNTTCVTDEPTGAICVSP